MNLKDLLTEKKKYDSTPIKWNGRTYYIKKDYMGLKNVFAFEDPEMKKVAKHPNGGTLGFRVKDIQGTLK